MRRHCTSAERTRRPRSHRRGHWFDPSIAHEKPWPEARNGDETRAFDGRGSTKASRGLRSSGCFVRVIIVCQRARGARRVVCAPGIDVQQTPGRLQAKTRARATPATLDVLCCATPRSPAPQRTPAPLGPASERHDQVHVCAAALVTATRPVTSIFGHSFEWSRFGHSGESRSSLESGRGRSASSRGGGASFVEAAGHLSAWSCSRRLRERPPGSTVGPFGVVSGHSEVRV
jgi:hypothetical protein